MSQHRASGLLLHLTSLPGRHGIGDMGPEAYQFADFLVSAGQSLWQMLPIVPVGYGWSPYAAPSTFAGNELLISPDLLAEDGLLPEGFLNNAPTFPDGYVDFEAALAWKHKVLFAAWDMFSMAEGSAADGSAADGSAADGSPAGGSVTGGSPRSHAMQGAFHDFCRSEAHWLDDYALFEVLKDEHDRIEWMAWKPEYAMRHEAAIENARTQYATRIERVKFIQFLFNEQWRRLKDYCNRSGVRIFGDLPIYVAQDSADVWANRELFTLDTAGRATAVSGVPPDYFSETGQRWGNPIYRWDRMKETDYAWWTRRMARILDLVDLVRLDHFRGFEAYWEVPATEETAINGAWKAGPGADLFESLERQLGTLPLIAENLGVITDGVTDLMNRFGFPGMAILQFAFDAGPENEFLPHNYAEPLVAYTGTHDNDTFMGWWTHTQSTQQQDITLRAKAYCRAYLDLECHPEEDIHWRAIRALMGSVARFVVTPVQDVLGLGAEARMNTPGLSSGNWGWRLCSGELNQAHAEQLAAFVDLFGRR